jgi:nucleotide-binding universal stress UspA family protein
MIMFPARSILAAVDFSESSRAALEFAARLANHCSGTLHVLHVQDPLLAAAAQSERIDLIGESRDELVRFTQRGVAVDRPRLQHHVVTGRSTLAICDLAVRERVDLIVLGMHGMSGTARALFGSTTQGVLQQSAVPVSVIPDSWAAPRPETRDLSGVGPVLVAVECSGTGIAAAAAASQLATTLGTLVSAVHVVEQLNVLDRWSVHAQAAMDVAVAHNRREIETALAGLKTHTPIPLRIETGSVAERISHFAAPRAGEHPILVLGRHAQGSRRGVPGATAYRVLGMTEVPVLMHCVPEDPA